MDVLFSVCVPVVLVRLSLPVTAFATCRLQPECVQLGLLDAPVSHKQAAAGHHGLSKGVVEELAAPGDAPRREVHRKQVGGEAGDEVRDVPSNGGHRVGPAEVCRIQGRGSGGAAG